MAKRTETKECVLTADQTTIMESLIAAINEMQASLARYQQTASKFVADLAEKECGKQSGPGQWGLRKDEKDLIAFWQPQSEGSKE